VRRATHWIALLLALGALLLLLLPYVLTGGRGDAPELPAVRPAPSIPSPDEAGRIRYFHRLVASGERVELPSPLAGTPTLEVSVWREIGALALARMGEPAMDYLVDPARYPEYRAAPNLLLTTLQILAGAPALRLS